MPRDPSTIVPRGERLRRAVSWLSDQGRHDVLSVEEAARRFDLTPAQEQFLLEHFVEAPADDRGER